MTRIYEFCPADTNHDNQDNHCLASFMYYVGAMIFMFASDFVFCLRPIFFMSKVDYVAVPVPVRV